jgi:hypothetical protein
MTPSPSSQEEARELKASDRLLRVGMAEMPLEVQLELGEIYADVCALEQTIIALRAALDKKD